MNVSLNYIKDNLAFDPYKIGVDDLVSKIGSQLGAVENVNNVSNKWQSATVVKVVQCAKHPNADKLSVCLVDDMGINKDVSRNVDGLVTVVCGAPNVHSDMLAVWLPPGAIVPSTYNDKEPFKLGKRTLRGVESNGMLASASELGLSNESDGILELVPKDFDKLPKPGTPFADLLSLNDTILDLENKMFTHRPDCFGLIGVAREFAGISHEPFKSPDWYLTKTNLPEPNNDLSITLDNKIPDLVPRFIMQLVQNITVGESPLWLQAFLARIGQKSINNIVDITNYMMIVTGQPLHAFDYDKVAKLGNTNEVGPRMAQSNEKIALLNGKTINLDSNDIVIAAGETPIALAGVMGGADTEVDLNTKNIIIECATFNMYSVRRTSMRHGLFTDAVTRYTKGQSPLQNDIVLAQTVKYILLEAGGNIATSALEAGNPNDQMPKIIVSASFINNRLGSNILADKMAELLQNVEIEVSLNNDELTITPPFWRTDLAIKEDIVEEIGRLYGYSNINVILPKREVSPANKDNLLKTKNYLREILKNMGSNELLTYSFVHEKLLLASNQDPNNSYAVTNAISPALQYYRQSVSPSILDKVHQNIKSGYKKFALFELGKGHNKKLPLVNGVPQEQELLAYTFVSLPKNSPKGAAFYQAKMVAQELFNKLGIQVSYQPLVDTKDLPDYAKIFEPKRSALVYSNTNQLLGVVGEYLGSITNNLKLPNYCSGFELDIANLQVNKKDISTYKLLYKYPSTELDITLESLQLSNYDLIYKSLEKSFKETIGSDIEWNILPLNIFVKDNIKRYSFRLKLIPKNKTLTSKEANSILDSAVLNLLNNGDIKII